MGTQYEDLIADWWYQTDIMLDGDTIRTSTGVIKLDPKPVKASVNATARMVTNAQGQEVLASATLKWHVDGPLPKPTDTVTLPPEYGLAPSREIITARRVKSGLGLTPGHVEVTLK